MKLAAIDIGSNAARLLIVEANRYNKNEVDFTKLNLIRIPIQLGYDVFQNGHIGEDKKHNFIETIGAFKMLMGIYQVKHYKACATSAMRDAANGQEIADIIFNETGINIEIISGQQEASILYETHIAEKFHTQLASLYVDVGGGSTELTLFAQKQIVAKESFNIGTIRHLNQKIDSTEWTALSNFIATHVNPLQPIHLIGSGGNINKIFSMSNTKSGKPLKIKILKDYLKELSALSVNERIHQYQLKEDRAVVVVPALDIYLKIMQWSGANEIYVPKIGLADGLIKMLYTEIKEEQ